MAVVSNWRALDTAWQKKREASAKLIEEDERNRALAEEEIRAIKLRILRVKGAGGTKLENVRFIPRSICAMPIKAQSWYEIDVSWIRNPERMIFATIERDCKVMVYFTERFDQATQSFGFLVSISWE